MPRSLTRAEIKYERLKGGGRLLTHPSGVQVVEEAAEIAERRERLVARRDRIEGQIAAHDALAAEVGALDERTAPAGLPGADEEVR